MLNTKNHVSKLVNLIILKITLLYEFGYSNLYTFQLLSTFLILKHSGEP